MSSVTIYAAIKDSIFLNLYQIKIRDKQVKIALLNQHSFFVSSKKNICQKIANNFTEFSRIFVERIGNYTAVFLAINIGIGFEVVYGSKTLAVMAILWRNVGYFVCIMALLIILLGYRFYEKSLHESTNLLLEI
ncbi:MAG: hypothetical protein F6K26_52390, partial [Moorea sp. SIO2I5]|nr:hypothetical protein [Moorena sp. SIO2I5]